MAAFKIGRTYRWAGFGSHTLVRTFQVRAFVGQPGSPYYRVVVDVLSRCNNMEGPRSEEWNCSAVDCCVEIDGTEDTGLTLVVGDTPAPVEFKIPRPPKA